MLTKKIYAMNVNELEIFLREGIVKKDLKK